MNACALLGIVYLLGAALVMVIMIVAGLVGRGRFESAVGAAAAVFWPAVALGLAVYWGVLERRRQRRPQVPG